MIAMLPFIFSTFLLSITLARICKLYFDIFNGNYMLTKCVSATAHQKVDEMQPKIVGGVNASPDKIKYVVRLLYFKSYHCGGVIIGSKTIITAAQCVEGFDVKHLSVKTGFEGEGGGNTIVPVAKAIVHEGYKDGADNNDIAILKLTSKIEFQKINLPTQGQKLKVGKKLVIVGWGSEFVGSSTTLNEHFKQATVPVVSDKDCEDVYSSFDQTTMFCAGNK